MVRVLCEGKLKGEGKWCMRGLAMVKNVKGKSIASESVRKGRKGQTDLHTRSEKADNNSERQITAHTHIATGRSK